MALLRKIGSGLTAFILLFFLTGFFGSGEKPQDGINAIIKAIENNDSRAFAERVPLEFWISLCSLRNDKFQNAMKTAMSVAKVPSGAKDFTSALATAITPDVRRMARALQQEIHRQIDAGRTGMQKNSLWTPEVLGKMTASEAGTGAEEGTATTIIEVGDVKMTLGLAKINDKWMLMGAGGNKKSAVDTTLVLKNQVEQRAAELVQRRKGNEQWLKEFGPFFAEATKLDDEKCRQFLNKIIPGDAHELLKGKSAESRVPPEMTLKSPELWDIVTDNLLETLRLPNLNENARKVTLGKESCTNYKTELTEVVFQKGDVLITKSWTFFKENEAQQEQLKKYEQWLSGVMDEADESSIYACFIKKDRRWTMVAAAENSFGSVFCSYIGKSSDFPFTPVEYLEEFGKRYAKLEENAGNILKNEQGWKESLQKSLKDLSETVAAKNGKALGDIMNIPGVLRNRDTVEASALWRLEKIENDQDIKTFGQEIDKGTLSPENPFNGLDFAAATVKSVTEMRGVAIAGKRHLLFERDKASSPWKLMRVTETERPLILPADWEKQIEAKMVSLREERVQNAQKLTELMTTLKNNFTVALPDALEKKNPDAVLALLSLNTLALCPKMDCTPEQENLLKKQVAPLASYTRSLHQAITSSKPLPGLEDLWNTAALRKAEITLDNKAYPHSSTSGFITVTTGSGPRKLFFFASHATWKLASAPLVDMAAEPTGEAKTLAARPFSPTPAQKTIAELITLLVEKKGAEFVEHVNLAAMNFWDLNTYPSDNDFGLATIFPEVLQPQRQAIIDSIAASGACDINGIRLDGESLELASVEQQEDGSLRVILSTGELWFVPAEQENKVLLVHASIAPKKYSRNLVRSYASVNEFIAKSKNKIQKEAALNACVESVLDTVQLTIPSYEVKQIEHYSNLHLMMQADVLNTNSKPVKLERFILSITDDKGHERASIIFHSKSALLQANRPVRLPLAIEVNKEIVYWLQQVKAGKARLAVRPYQVEIGEKQYSRNDLYRLESSLKKSDDGTWQLGSFPPVKSRPRLTIPVSRDENKALELLLQKQKEEEEAKSLQYTKEYLKQFKIHYDLEKTTFTVQNTTRHEARNTTVTVEIIDQGIVINSKNIGYSSIIKPQSSENFKKSFTIPTGADLEFRILEIDTRGMRLNMEDPLLYSGVVPPLLYQEDPVLLTLTAEQAAGTVKPHASVEASKAEASKVKTPKADASAEVSKAEAPKPEAPKAETSPTGASTTDTPIPPEGKNSGKAVLGVTAMDLVGLDTFGTDGKPDSAIRVSVKNPSPLVAIRIDNIGGTMASWKTKDVKTSAKGVIAVVRDGKPLNADNATFSLDVTAPVVLDLLVQDTGVIAEGKTRLRAVFHHQDGKRSYAILESVQK